MVAIMLRSLLAWLLLTLALTGPTLAQSPSTSSITQPEAGSGWSGKPVVRAREHLVVTAHGLASQAADQVLREGGTAIDAAIAAQLVLGLVEPQSSGIGGGGFLLHYDARSRAVTTLDGRETAPAEADEQLLSDPEGKPLRFAQVVAGGRSVGVPGLIRMMETAYRQHGRLPWARLFEPAINLAREGFPVSHRLNHLATRDRFLPQEAQAARYFMDSEGRPWPIGHRLRNPDYAQTLQTIARDGADAFYDGAIARDIVDAVRRHPRNPGSLTRSDLSAYRAIEREAICLSHHRYWVCGMPPPSSGAITVGQILGLFSTPTGSGRAATLVQHGRFTEAGTHRFLEAARLAFADRNHWIADPAFSPQPVSGLLDGDYLAQRARLIGERAVAGAAPLGIPPGAQPLAPRTHRPDLGSVEFELESTTHFVIVDRQGNAVSMTSSIEDAFGSRVMVRGFLLNNQLTDFSVAAGPTDRPPANRPQAGKRPRSSMAPTIVFERGPNGERGEPRLLLGSPGGANIVSYVARTLIAVLDEGLPLQQAIELPNLGNRNGPSELEAGRISPALIQALQARGHEVREVDMTSGLHGIQRTCNERRVCEWVSGIDPRREGEAIGR